MYVFDTNTFTLCYRMHPVVLRYVFQHLSYDLVTSTITAEEQVMGWITKLRKARTPADIETASRRFAETIRYLGAWDILPYTAAADARFWALDRLNLGVKNPDLRIAAIALEADATVVTANLIDFERIPGLRVEDWTR
ncbi:MAG: type II toxin-antitoxin system VapC family toxin [Fimbriiglobus sp.]